MNPRRRVKEVREGAAQLVRRHRPDYQIILFMGVLLLLGVVVLYAISPARVELMNAGGEDLSQAHFMQRQFLYLFLGLVAFGVTAATPISFWKKYAGKILVVGLAACLLLALLGLFNLPPALCTMGACRWYDLGFTTFQPAELLKFGVLIFVAIFLGRRMGQGKVNDIQETVIPMALVTGAAGFFIIVAQRDMGSGIALLGIVAAMFFVAGINKRIGMLAGGALVALGVLLIIMAPHRIERVATFLSPSSDADDSSYHINQAKIAIGSGGLVGLGLGMGASS